MKTYTIEVEITEDGDIKLETFGMEGKVCDKELEQLLNKLEGIQTDKKKPEYNQTNIQPQVKLTRK